MIASLSKHTRRPRFGFRFSVDEAILVSWGRDNVAPMSLLARISAVTCALCLSAAATNAHAILDAALIEAGPVDAGGCEAGSGLSCEQCDTSGYTPVEMQMPIGPMAAMCTDADISAFVTACGVTGTQTTCGAWEASASKTCSGCLLTAQSASTWGPLVCGTTMHCAYNSGGCIDLALGQVTEEVSQGGAGSCGDAVNASFGCQDYACDTCSTTDFATCATSAETNECEAYTAAQTSTTGPCGAIDGGAIETACFPQDDSDITTMVTFMCGGLVAPPPDAGSDAGTPVDAGSGSDASTPKDAGKDTGTPVDSGSDAGDTSFNSGGCHCDAAGVAGTQGTLMMVTSLGALAAVLASRRRKRR
jgi:hypothetical protein